MRSFQDLDAFCAHLGTLKAKVEHAQRAELQRLSKIIKEDAKAQLGHYQPAVGPLPAWADLAEFTKAARARAGHAPDEPLLVTGHLRDSIHYRTEIGKAVIGSDSDIAVYQELGTPNAEHPIPPRPFLGGAAFRHSANIAESLATAVAEAFAGHDPHAEEGEDR